MVRLFLCHLVFVLHCYNCLQTRKLDQGPWSGFFFVAFYFCSSLLYCYRPENQQIRDHGQAFTLPFSFCSSLLYYCLQTRKLDQGPWSGFFFAILFLFFIVILKNKNTDQKTRSGTMVRLFLCHFIFVLHCYIATDQKTRSGTMIRLFLCHLFLFFIVILLDRPENQIRDHGQAFSLPFSFSSLLYCYRPENQIRVHGQAFSLPFFFVLHCYIAYRPETTVDQGPWSGFFFDHGP